MKRIVIVFSLIIIYVSINFFVIHSEEQAVLNINENEITITFINNNLLVTNKENTMLYFNKNNYYDDRFGEITNKIDINKLKYKNIDSIDYESNNGLITIDYIDYNFCIYYEKIISNINTFKCNFLYLYSNDGINNLNIDENTSVVFIDNNKTISNHFIEDIYSKWIDIYRLNVNEYTLLKISNEDYKILVIPK